MVCVVNDTGAEDDQTPSTETGPGSGPGTSSSGPPTSGGGIGTGGKYVPPSMRSSGTPGSRMPAPGSSPTDLPTLRITNISSDTLEADLRELFSSFGRVSRVYVGRDRDTGAGKGFAFVSFEERAAAVKAIEKVNGRGYDNLILSVQWSREWFFFVVFFGGGADDDIGRAETGAEMIVWRTEGRVGCVLCSWMCSRVYLN
jgi:translation initiation factor 3 subunit G